MLLNRTLLIIKNKVVDVPLIIKHIKDGRYMDDAFRMYNDTVGHKSFGRFKLTKSEFQEIWGYLK